MNVVHYIGAFSSLSQTFIYDLITGLEAREISKNTVITRRRELKDQRPFSDVLICKDKNPIRKFITKFTDPSHLKIHDKKIIITHLNRINPKIIHSHFAISALKMNDLIMSKNINLPHVCSFHGNDILSRPFIIKGYKEALLKLNDNPNVIMTVPSLFLKNACIQLGLNSDKIRILPNTIHTRFLSATASLPWNGTDKLKIVTVGRLVEMKGHEYALKALAILKKDFSNFEYLIAGSGSLEFSLKELAEKLGLQGNVKFLGGVPHSEVLNLLTNCHICLIPGVKDKNGGEDTFCLSLVEGSVAGLYCLSSDTKGPAEVLGPNKEFIFPQKNPEAILTKLIEFINNPEESFKKSQLLKNYMLENFHPEIYFKNYKNLYESITDNNKPRVF